MGDGFGQDFGFPTDQPIDLGLELDFLEAGDASLSTPPREEDNFCMEERSAQEDNNEYDTSPQARSYVSQAGEVDPFIQELGSQESGREQPDPVIPAGHKLHSSIQEVEPEAGVVTRRAIKKRKRITFDEVWE